MIYTVQAQFSSWYPLSLPAKVTGSGAGASSKPSALSRSPELAKISIPLGLE